MADLHPALLWLASVYSAAAVGILSALVIRGWTRRHGRLATPPEAAWCAFLPPLAVLLLPLTALEPHLTQLPGLHAAWHRWEQAVHTAPLTHGVLHAANSLLLLLGAFFFARAVFTLTQMRAFAASVRSAARPQPLVVAGSRLYSLPSPQPLCFTMGLLRPAVYVTTSLQELLSPRDYEAMLAHEAAHIRRRDGLSRAFLSLFYALFPLPGSSLLLRDWHRAAERDCDAEAACQIGSAADVAAALIRVAQAMARSSTVVPGGACFAAFGDDIEGRVQVLLALPATHSRVVPIHLVILGLAFLLASSSWIHHAAELFTQH
jgi:Zn-dependent protease with chaperone function